MDKKIIGIDVGGTNIKIGLLNKNGDILYKWNIPTNKETNGVNIVDDIWRSISSKLPALLINNQIMGIGVGAPGFVDKKQGLVYEAVNIGWLNYELSKQLNAYSNLPVFIENDANLAALGENWKGAGNRVDNLIVVTLGTGVGSGIIANGSILNGYKGTAGEIGHITVEPDGSTCNCGRVGCLDTIASGTGIVNQAIEQISKSPTSALGVYFLEKGSLTAEDIFYFANMGDAICENVIKRTADALGYILANTATIINPSKILIGGGVSKAGNQLLNLVKKSFQKFSLPRISENCNVELATLGNDAGILGAAYLVLQQTNTAHNYIN